MAEIKESEIEHLAVLARLEINNKEQEFTQEIEEILDFVDELKNAQTAGIEPISQISGLSNIARADVQKESFPREEMLKNAPDQKEGFIKVKKVFE